MQRSSSRRAVASWALLCLMGLVPFASAVSAEPTWAAHTVAEMKIKELPAGPLYWEIETFPTLAQAQAAASRTSLAAEAAGKAWLFTVAAKGTASPGGSKVAEIGPVPLVDAPEYMLRVLQAGGPPGAKTAVHMHPGSEAFYVLAGQLSQQTQHGVGRVDAGQSMPGHDAGTVMQVSSTGSGDLTAFVLFVVDANKQFFVPSKFE